MSNQEVKPTLILGMRRRIARKFVMRVEELGRVKKNGKTTVLSLSWAATPRRRNPPRWLASEGCSAPSGTVGARAQFCPRQPLLPVAIKFNLGVFKYRGAAVLAHHVRAGMRTEQRPVPAQRRQRATIFVDASDCPLAAEQGVVQAVAINRRRQIGRAQRERHRIECAEWRRGTKPDSACQKRVRLLACCCIVLHTTAFWRWPRVLEKPNNHRLFRGAAGKD